MFQRQFPRIVMSLTAGVVLCASVASANLITNGDFSGGATGFSTGYSYVPPAPSTSCWPEGSYTVGTDPNLCHYLWASFGDHTTGSGNMLIVNGAPTANAVVWSETFGIQTNTNYTFSAWVAGDYPSSPAQLEFLVNGTQVGGTFTASTTPGQWQQFSGNWSSGASTTATLSIVDLNLVRGGNDFALDDLSFADSVPESNPWILLSLALAGIAWQGRRRALCQPR